MKFNFDFIQRVKQANDIVDVVSSYGLSPKKQGRSYVCLCPFHTDHKPSLNLSPDGQYYYCFVCNEGGDAIKFVMKKENVTFMEAVQRLAEAARIPLEFDGTPDAHRDYRQKNDQKKRLYDLNRAAEQWFANNLNSPAGREMQAYLVSRGIQQETWTAFGVGYAPKGWTALLEALTNEGYDGADLDAAGLSRQNPETQRRTDFFMDRIMFPIRDLQGKTIGFSGRQAPGNEFGGKYINTPGTLLYNKSAALFGVDLAMAEMRERDVAILVEGQLDVLSMHQAGWRNTVAASGSAVTEQHLQILRRLCGHILIATDGDTAGLKAAERALVPLIRIDIPCKVALFPEGQDPADILKTDGGAQVVRQCLDGALDAFEYKFQQLKAGRSTLDVHAISDIAREMLELFHQTPDPLKLQRWREQIALRLGLAPGSLPVPRIEAPRPERNERGERVAAEARDAQSGPGGRDAGGTQSSSNSNGAGGDDGSYEEEEPRARPVAGLDRDVENLIQAERNLIWLLLHHPPLMLRAESKVDFYGFQDWRHLVIATGLMVAMQGSSLTQRRVLDAITRAEYDHLAAQSGAEGSEAASGTAGNSLEQHSGRATELAIQLLERKHSASRIFSETLAEDHLRGAVDALRKLQIKDQLRRIKMQLQETLDEQEKYSLEKRKADLMREMVALGNALPV